MQIYTLFKATYLYSSYNGVKPKTPWAFLFSFFLHFTTTTHSLFLLDFESCLLKVWCEVIFYLSENIFSPVQTNVQHTFYSVNCETQSKFIRKILESCICKNENLFSFSKMLIQVKQESKFYIKDILYHHQYIIKIAPFQMVHLVSTFKLFRKPDKVQK